MPIASPVIVTLALLAASIAQEKPKPPLPAASTEAVKLEVDPKDVATIDGIIGALYGAISGPQGEKRNWDRFRALFHPDARMLPIVRRADGIARAAIITPDEYIKRTGARLTDIGFVEKEIARRTEQFHHIAHVWSTYEATRAAKPDEVYVSGINSIQLMWDNKRWWILQIAWSPTDKDHPIPNKYRQGK